MLWWGLPLSPGVVCPSSLAPSLHAPRAHSACVVWSWSVPAVGLDFILPRLIPVVLAFLQPVSSHSLPASLLPTALSKLLPVHLEVPGAGRKQMGVNRDLEGISKGARRRNC